MQNGIFRKKWKKKRQKLKIMLKSFCRYFSAIWQELHEQKYSTVRIVFTLFFIVFSIFICLWYDYSHVAFVVFFLIVSLIIANQKCDKQRETKKKDWPLRIAMKISFFRTNRQYRISFQYTCPCNSVHVANS